MSDKRVAIISPYFGKFPIWFDLFLYSCSKNPTIDFIFITDCEIPQNVYKNTKFIRSDFDSYCSKVSKILSINFNHKDPYKLCDLKPFYGIIHKDELKEYDFWGFGDCDLIYGNLEIIINQLNLSKYDFITTHNDRIAGHFTIIRNDSKFTNQCMLIPHWKEKLEDLKHYALDEEDFCDVIYPTLKNIKRIYRYLIKPLGLMRRDTFFRALNIFFCNKFTKILFKECFTTPLPKKTDEWIYDLNTGSVKKNKKNEIPYIHFLPFKKNRYFELEYSWDDDFYHVKKTEIMTGKGLISINVDEIVYKND